MTITNLRLSAKIPTKLTQTLNYNQSDTSEIRTGTCRDSSYFPRKDTKSVSERRQASHRRPRGQKVINCVTENFENVNFMSEVNLTRLQRHQFKRHLVYNVRFNVVPINSPLLSKTIHLSHYLTNLMHKICITISFISSLYMFRAHVLIISRSKLYYTAPGTHTHSTHTHTQ